MRRRLALIVVSILLAATQWAGSPAVPRTEAATLPLAGIVIALDPGHNGGNASHIAQISRKVWVGNGWRACATVGTTTLHRYTEHKFNYTVALRVKARLQALGATVYMTRQSDTGVGPCVDWRGHFGTRVHARLTVAIHADGAPSQFRGFYVMRPGLVRGYTDDIIESSLTLARAMRTGLVRAGLPIANYYASNGLKTRTDFGTFNFSDIPVVMLELGNMKNAGDARRMESYAGRDRYAIGIVNGIRVFLHR